MNVREVLSSLYGEFMDLVNCRAIDLGRADPRYKFSFDEVLQIMG